MRAQSPPPNNDPDSGTGAGDGTEPLTFSFVTDVEGNVQYFRRFVAISEALLFVPNDDASGGLTPRLELNDGFGVVFGGDLFDKGPGDLQLAEWFCDLKERYPDRVFLLLGNRDINNLRFLAELEAPASLELPATTAGVAAEGVASPHESSALPTNRRPVVGVPCSMYTLVGPRLWDQRPFWDRHAPSFVEWLAKCHQSRLGEELRQRLGQHGHMALARTAALRRTPSSLILQLKWMLEHTLGCASTFEFRRQELMHRRRRRRRRRQHPPTPLLLSGGLSLPPATPTPKQHKRAPQQRSAGGRGIVNSVVFDPNGDGDDDDDGDDDGDDSTVMATDEDVLLSFVDSVRPSAGPAAVLSTTATSTKGSSPRAVKRESLEAFGEGFMLR